MCFPAPAPREKKRERKVKSDLSLSPLSPPSPPPPPSLPLPAEESRQTGAERGTFINPGQIAMNPLHIRRHRLIGGRGECMARGLFHQTRASMLTLFPLLFSGFYYFSSSFFLKYKNKNKVRRGGCNVTGFPSLLSPLPE